MDMSTPIEAETDVLIVGAGISGIGAAYHLQQRSPGKSYQILEARSDVGGTWDLFRYPGIRSDSDMFTFGFNFRPWMGGKVFADGPSIKQYITDTANEAGIMEKIRFDTRVVRAEWNGETARWTVEAEIGETRERKRFSANFLILCSGYYRYERGYMPDFPGMESFEGDIIHPQLWDESYDYSGKRVVIIGSGATAVTLVPAMAQTAGHVAMLQRSPTYIANRPSRDAMADWMRKYLPRRLAYVLIRAKLIGLGMFFFNLARKFPGFVKKGVLKKVREELGPEFDVEKHFSPSYNPWDQRFCLAPDGDFFAALRSGKASIHTDHIERFDRSGIQLKSGQRLDADLIIPATGLDMMVGGGIELVVDGDTVDPSEHVTYRGMMLSGVPNCALAFGYTNASWTLKIDLTHERICRLLNHMDEKGYDYCVPVPPEDLETQDLLDFSSGYVRRAIHTLPRQGTKAPWKTYQNYLMDMLTIRFGPLEDGHMRFAKARAEAKTRPAVAQAAE